MPSAPRSQAEAASIKKVAELLRESKSPVIITEACGRDVDAFRALVCLVELLAIPVMEPSKPFHANFPKDHPLHMGFDSAPFLGESDLFLVIEDKAP